MLINNLRNKKILVWGYGIEGKSAVDFLLKNNITKDIIVATKDSVDEKVNGIVFINENDILNQDVDVIIKSAGISMYRPEIKQLEKNGIVITHIYNILFAEILDYKKKNNKKFPKVIGISGTKGKTTTSSMCEHILKTLGYKTVLLGNVGKSALDVINNFREYDYIVIEISSQQCKTLKYPVDYSVLLNLFKEHIDWHLTHKNYFDDKMLLLKYGKKFVLPNSCDEALRRLPDNRDKDYIFFDTVSGFHLKNDDNIYYINEKIADISEYKNINGRHFFKNLCAVLSVLKAENIDIQKAMETLKTFRMPEHRLEVFFKDEKNSTVFIKDSIATIPEATIEAVKSVKNENIFLILGGKDRQKDVTSLIIFLNKNTCVKKVFLLGETGKIIYNMLKENNFNNYYEYFESLQDIVNAIKKCDLKNTTVLLSPASPSFDMFKNFEERGKIFKSLMLE